MGLNKKVIGLMKDEMSGDVIEEFIALRPKLYSYRVGSKEHKKCKGIKKNVVKKTLTFEDYKNYLFSKIASCHLDLTSMMCILLRSIN